MDVQSSVSLKTKNDLRFSGRFGKVDLSLVYQLERGGRWYHMPGRPNWISAENRPDWLGGAIYTASNPIDVDDETRLYICSSIDDHGWMGADVDREKKMKELSAKGGSMRIGLLSWPRNRLMGYHATHRERLILEPLCSEAERQLAFNARLQTGGSLRAELRKNDEAIPGYSMSDCDALTGDHLNKAVTWKGKEKLPQMVEGDKFEAVIEIERGTLYAFDFSA